MKFRMLAALAAVLAVCSASAYEWKDVTKENRLGGRMISAGYLRGKVVLVDCRDYGDKANEADVRQLQELWSTFKSKPFILLGSHRGTASAADVAARLAEWGVTYPVYRGAAIDKDEPKDETGRPFFYLMDSTCQKRRFTGRDVHRVQRAIGDAVVNDSVPMTKKQWRHYLDWELVHLPGKGYNRLREFRKAYPGEAGDYDAQWEKLSDDADVPKLAKLVDFATKVKDRDSASAGAQRLSKELLNKAIEKYAPLKQSANPVVVQEAKNALADLAFTAATL
jgi:pimeloyl-ACP methyl ester carboxylesterase